MKGAAGDVVALLANMANMTKPADARSVALVAHEPILSAIAAALTGKSRYPALRKAEALRIRLPDGPGTPGTLRWRVDGGDPV